MKRRNQQTRKLKDRQLELIESAKYSQRLKEKVVEYHGQLEQAYKLGKISYPEYKRKYSQVLEGKKLREWTDYYDKCIRYYKQEYSKIDRELNPHPVNSQNLVIPILIVGILLVSMLGTAILTGTTILEENSLFGDSISGFAVDDSIANTSISANFTQEEIDAGGNETGFEEITAVIPIEDIQNESTKEVIAIIPVNNQSESIVPSVNDTLEQVISIIPINNESTNINPEEVLIEDPIIEKINFKVIDTEIEELTSSRVIAGEPVLWTKQVQFGNLTSNAKVNIPRSAIIVGIKEIENSKVKVISYENINVNDTGKVTNIIQTNLVKPNLVPLSSFSGVIEWLVNIFKRNFSSITGLAISEKSQNLSENVTLIIDKSIEKVVIEYYTQAPLLEEVATKEGKIVTISSQFHYQDVLTYSYFNDIEFDGINLYWLVNGTKVPHGFSAYDLNGNDLVDYIEWNTPHLSNESFEIDLDILDIKSYPVVGGNWTVRFNTSGTSDLTITAYNGTNWSNTVEDYDLKFLEVKCGNNSISTQWINSSVHYNNYSCEPMSYEISKVITTGEHTLQFKFGNITKYAYNNASNIGIRVSDGSISFGSGHYDPSCSTGFSTIYSNTSKVCWINTTAFPVVEDFHVIENNGTGPSNITATLQQANNAEDIFCKVGGCTSDHSRISIESVNIEANSCVSGLANGFQLMADNITKQRARICNELQNVDSNDELKIYYKLQVPEDQVHTSHEIVVAYEALAL
jgi:hypothetical protein